MTMQPTSFKEDEGLSSEEYCTTRAILTVEEPWTPLDPHCLNLNLMRRNTACTLDEIMDFSQNQQDISPMSTRKPLVPTNLDPLPIYDWDQEDSFCGQIAVEENSFEPQCLLEEEVGPAENVSNIEE